MERYPWWEDLGIDRKGSWWGYYGVTPDNSPVIGFNPGTRGWVDACGFSGHGIMHAPATGLAVSELVAKLRPDMLRFAEEIMLLLLDDEGQRFLRVPDWSLRYALAAGVLMDLALEDRIDTDLEQLILIDPTPTGDDILDPALADIAAATETHDARF